MIQNDSVLDDLKNDWKGIDKLLSIVKGTSYVLPSGDIFQENEKWQSYNIPFLLSYVVLDNVLSAFHGQGNFTCKEKRTLNNLMEASRPHIPWRNFDTINKGRLARNELAHEAVLLSKEECIRFIEAIRLELVGWSIL